MFLMDDPTSWDCRSFRLSWLVFGDLRLLDLQLLVLLPCCLCSMIAAPTVSVPLSPPQSPLRLRLRLRLQQPPSLPSLPLPPPRPTPQLLLLPPLPLPPLPLRALPPPPPPVVLLI